MWLPKLNSKEGFVVLKICCMDKVHKEKLKGLLLKYVVFKMAPKYFFNPRHKMKVGSVRPIFGKRFHKQGTLLNAELQDLGWISLLAEDNFYADNK